MQSIPFTPGHGAVQGQAPWFPVTGSQIFDERLRVGVLREVQNPARPWDPVQQVVEHRVGERHGGKESAPH